jgi:hypothetical protein
MKTVKLINVSLVLGIVAILIAMASFTSLASAQDAEEAAQPETTQAETTEESESTEATEEVSSEKFTYVAQNGDSYTKMARKAVQTYGIQTSTNLSGAQIVFVETNLTLAAGSPVLTLGQEVSIDSSLVSEWVTKAGELNETQTAAWQVYADGVDFNTDAVGEARE